MNRGDGVWLDVLTWSVADGEERVMAKADQLDALNEMRGRCGNQIASSVRAGILNPSDLPLAAGRRDELWVGDERQGRFPELRDAG